MASQSDGRIPAIPARQARSNHVTVRVQLKVTHPSNAGECKGSQMSNNCKMIKSVYGIYDNGIGTGSSTVLGILLVMFISLGSMSNCLRGPAYSD